jgi:hypothetical protein
MEFLFFLCGIYVFTQQISIIIAGQKLKCPIKFQSNIKKLHKKNIALRFLVS